MKFALVDGSRREAEPGLAGYCQGCGKLMVSKCGKIKIHHWAHKGIGKCDPWWECETEWHRSWKNKFPTDWQEVSSRDEFGELHIADVKTDLGWAIEFQHSHLPDVERIARNNFYKKLVWVVNGNRISSGELNFKSALMSSMKLENFYKIYPDKNPLVKEWINSSSPVLFDFGESPNVLDTSDLWLLLPKSSDGMAYLKALDRKLFLDVMTQGSFNDGSDLEDFLIQMKAQVLTDNNKWDSFHRLKLDKLHGEIQSSKSRY